MFLLSAFPITTAISSYPQTGLVLKATYNAPQSVGFFGYLNYGSGGTTIDAFIQTSYDGGASWWDILHFTQWTTGSAAYLYNATDAVNSSNFTTLTNNQSLGAGTGVTASLGGMFRALLTTTGTYVATALTLTMLSDTPLSNASGLEK